MEGGLLFKKQDQITMLGAEEGMIEGMTEGIMVAEETTKEEVVDIEEVETEDTDAAVTMDAAEGIATVIETDTEVQRLIFILRLLIHKTYAELQRKGNLLL